jgi:hypothetical protein
MEPSISFPEPEKITVSPTNAGLGRILSMDAVGGIFGGNTFIVTAAEFVLSFCVMSRILSDAVYVPADA